MITAATIVTTTTSASTAAKTRPLRDGAGVARGLEEA
jgi:hypothetical protein